MTLSVLSKGEAKKRRMLAHSPLSKKKAKQKIDQPVRVGLSNP